MSEEIVQTFSAVVIGTCVGVIGVALTRLRDRRLARPVYGFVVAGTLWAVGDLVATVTGDATWKQVGIVTLYTGCIAMVPLFWMIALRWAEGVGARLPLRNPWWMAGPFLFAGAMWLAMLTNPWHGQFITPVLLGRNVYQPIWYVMAVGCYGIVLSACAVEIVTAWRVRRSEVTRQAAFLAGSSFVILASNLVYITRLEPFNPTSLAISLAAMLLVLGMTREGLFGVLPAVLPAIADDHPDGLIVTGPDGRIRYANRRAHDLLAPVEVRLDAPIRSILGHADFRPDPAEALDAASEAEWSEALRRPAGVLFRGGDAGRPRWLHMSGGEVWTRRGRLKGYCLRMSDWTTQRQAELHQRQSRRLESVASLARTVSRDFQSTFSVIRGNAELLAKTARTDDAEVRRVSRIVEAADFGLDLAHELQLYAGSVDAYRSVLDLPSIAGEIRGLVEDELPPGVEVEVVPTSTSLSIEADPLQLRHGIYNLLMNAVEATPKTGGRIVLETGHARLDPSRLPRLVHGEDESPGDYVFVRVRDEAGGMDAETEERAFEPYFSRRGKDRGNGLPTVLGIVRAHQGLIELDNEPGRGCTFTLYFPVGEAARAAAPSDDPTADPRA